MSETVGPGSGERTAWFCLLGQRLGSSRRWGWNGHTAFFTYLSGPSSLTAGTHGTSPSRLCGEVLLPSNNVVASEQLNFLLGGRLLSEQESRKAWVEAAWLLMTAFQRSPNITSATFIWPTGSLRPAQA